MDAPTVLAVGDLHIENFGTWRDGEGRLVWGACDFDEAWELPYTSDLTRLAASALFARREAGLSLTARATCEAVLDGYRAGMRARVDGGAAPFVVDEQHQWLLPLVSDRDRTRFWAQLRGLPPAGRRVPAGAARALRGALPCPDGDAVIRSRAAGLGSLGRARFCVISEWEGSPIAREVKALAPSACAWAEGKSGATGTRIAEMLAGAIRARDPFFRIDGRWAVRRLSPACDKIPLSAAVKLGNGARLLHAMGQEAANVHVGSGRTIKSVLGDLDRRRGRWLRDAAKAMVRCTNEDWREWSNVYRERRRRTVAGKRRGR
jgi:hypothetical protein